ncbi:MAG: c-type cytochrome [Planctomycetes bacterium]|nr:c-type cytochrome [Planctomycetota bacterium]
MTRARAEALADLIEAEGKLEKSEFAGVQIPDRPFTPADVAHGKELFLGSARLRNGGAACLSCHTVSGVGGLGGGQLGPDLTRVFERYEDRRKLSAWLSAPATPTMGPNYKNHPLEGEEILALVAYFQEAAKESEEDSAPRALVLVLLGLGGAAGSFILFQHFWKDRFTGVRRALVTGAALPATAPKEMA